MSALHGQQLHRKQEGHQYAEQHVQRSRIMSGCIILVYSSINITSSRSNIMNSSNSSGSVLTAAAAAAAAATQAAAAAAAASLASLRQQQQHCEQWQQQQWQCWRLTGAMPDLRRMFEEGQWAIPTPASAHCFVSASFRQQQWANQTSSLSQPTRLYIHMLTHSCICCLTRLCTHPVVHSSIHPFVHPFVCSLTPPSQPQSL